MIWLVPVICALCWLTSLRRTPWPAMWFALALLNGVAGAAAVAGIESEGHTLAGLLAIGAVLSIPAAISVTATELCATDSGEVKSWRAGRPSRKLSRAAKWTVFTRVAKLDSGKETVWLGVRCAGRTRWIGEADPLADMDAFMELRVKADQAAETMNALKIEAS